MDFFWPAVLLPSIMVAFISEGSKFLIFDSALCRNSLWYRGGTEVLVPEKAESCAMGETGWFACAAGILHFWALVCVCLKAPERRILSKTFGVGDPDKQLSTKKEVQEATSDENDIEAGGEETDDNISHSSLLKIEESDPKKPSIEIEMNTKRSTRKTCGFDDGGLMMSSRACGSTSIRDLTLSLMPIPTNISSDGRCCSPLSNSQGGNFCKSSEDIIPDIPSREARTSGGLSPVDYLIEGFDVATDLSQIDVCRTMVYSPSHRVLEDGKVVQQKQTGARENEVGADRSKAKASSADQPHQDAIQNSAAAVVQVENSSTPNVAQQQQESNLGRQITNSEAQHQQLVRKAFAIP